VKDCRAPWTAHRPTIRSTAPARAAVVLSLAAALTSCEDSPFSIGSTFTLRLTVETTFVDGYTPESNTYTAFVSDDFGGRNEKTVLANGSVDFPDLGANDTDDRFLISYGVTDLPDGCTYDGPEEITSVSRAVEERTVEVVCRPYARSVFVQIDDPVEIRFGPAGDLFVGNSGISMGNAPTGKIRRVTPAGSITDFGDEVYDPDALIVDVAGSIASQAGAVLVGGRSRRTAPPPRS
jgi:hypothetical protein